MLINSHEDTFTTVLPPRFFLIYGWRPTNTIFCSNRCPASNDETDGKHPITKWWVAEEFRSWVVTRYFLCLHVECPNSSHSHTGRSTTRRLLSQAKIWRFWLNSCGINAAEELGAGGRLKHSGVEIWTPAVVKLLLNTRTQIPWIRLVVAIALEANPAIAGSKKSEDQRPIYWA